MKIELIEVGKLIPYAKNAKKHPDQQIEKLAYSIEKYGFNQPVVIDDKNCIVVGHARVLAAKKNKLQQVPVVRVSNLTKEQVKEYRVFDNKLNESNWDELLLAEEIENFDEETKKAMGLLQEENGEIKINANEEVDINELENDLKNNCPKCGFKF